MEQDSALGQWALSDAVRQLEIQLKDALEKNNQWLEYDQQREAHMRSILARILCLEKQLNVANQARSQQDNEEHSHERMLLNQMQEKHEGLLQLVKEEMEALREQVDMTRQKLLTVQNWYKERKSEVKKFMQQTDRISAPGEQQCSEDGEQGLSAESENLQDRQEEEERHRSADFQPQSTVFQECLLNHHHADQEKIADLERQLKITTQDLEDERQNCLYLTKKVLEMLKKSEEHVTEQPKEEKQEDASREEASPLYSNSPVNEMNESILKCPSCRADFPVSHYQDLIRHIEICME